MGAQIKEWEREQNKGGREQEYKLGNGNMKKNKGGEEWGYR